LLRKLSLIQTKAGFELQQLGLLANPAHDILRTKNHRTTIVLLEGRVRTMNRSSLLAIFLCFPAFAFAAKNPADYPLKVHILQLNWSSHNNYRNEFKGTGRGNLWEGNLIHAFDYSYECSFRLGRTARNQPYLAKWKQPHLRLALLAPQIGKEDKYQECTLKTTVHPGVYILGQGGITEMSQEDYKDWKAKRQENSIAPGSSAVSKLSIGSTPGSAEIEVDGDFMGNTPSTLELNPGEHHIAVRKTGYTVWEKTIKLAPGEVTVNAELQQESSQ
jgi:hypothetical protein